MEPSTEPESDTEPQPTVYLYGAREPAVMRIDPTQLGKWMMGADIPVDVALGQAIRAEFAIQERYRMVMLDAIHKACAAFLREAFDNVAPIEQPATDTMTAFWRGYAQGKYEAFCLAAAELADIQVTAALAIEPAQELTSDEQAHQVTQVG